LRSKKKENTLSIPRLVVLYDLRNGHYKEMGGVFGLHEPGVPEILFISRDLRVASFSQADSGCAFDPIYHYLIYRN
jgi:hypothetical protein